MTFPHARTQLLLLCFILFSTALYAQPKRQLQRSWIKTGMYQLPGNEKMADTTYTRYTFNKGGEVFISFYPAWNGQPMTWSMDGSQLTIGLSTWTIEELSDSTLTISQAGFRRFVLYAEDYLNKDKDHLIQ